MEAIRIISIPELLSTPLQTIPSIINYTIFGVVFLLTYLATVGLLFGVFAEAYYIFNKTKTIQEDEFNERA